MIVELDLKTLKEKGLSPDEYIYLRLLFSKELDILNLIFHDHDSVLKSLHDKGFMRRESGNYHMTEQGLSLFSYSIAWFNDFWLLWPGEKTAKDKCRKWYLRNIVSHEQHVRLMNGMLKQIEWREKARRTKEFIPQWPYPTTWLSQRRWEDELSEVINKEEQTVHVSGRNIL